MHSWGKKREKIKEVYGDDWGGDCISKVCLRRSVGTKVTVPRPLQKRDHKNGKNGLKIPSERGGNMGAEGKTGVTLTTRGVPESNEGYGMCWEVHEKEQAKRVTHTVTDKRNEHRQSHKGRKDEVVLSESQTKT